jgi:SM-20-related protein
MHFDSYAEQDGRKITCIVYLNRDWVPSDGGELALFPVPSSPVLIQPCFNRMVCAHSPCIIWL